MQQTRIMLLLITFVSFQQLIFASTKTQKSRCCDLETIAYRISTICGYNDYLCLANTNAVWHLKMKLKLQENMKDMDAYYLLSGHSINNKSTQIYLTPLHRAVKNGNIGCIRLLLNAGANKNKKITDNVDEVAHSSLGVIWGCVWDDNPTDAGTAKFLKNIHSHNHVGLTAIEIADHYLKNPGSSVSKEQRQAIYDLLRDHGKKEQ